MAPRNPLKIYDMYANTIVGKGAVHINTAINEFNKVYAKNLTDVTSRVSGNATLHVPSYKSGDTVDYISNTNKLAVTNTAAIWPAVKAAMAVDHPKDLPLVIDMTMCTANFMSIVPTAYSERYQSGRIPKNTSISVSRNCQVLKCIPDFKGDFNFPVDFDQNIIKNRLVNSSTGITATDVNFIFTSRNAKNGAIASITVSGFTSNKLSSLISGAVPTSTSRFSNKQSGAACVNSVNTLLSSFSSTDFTSWIGAQISDEHFESMNMKFNSVADMIIWSPDVYNAQTWNSMFISNTSSTPAHEYGVIDYTGNVHDQLVDYYSNMHIKSISNLFKHYAYTYDIQRISIKSFPLKSTASDINFVSFVTPLNPTHYYTRRLYTAHTSLNEYKKSDTSCEPCVISMYSSGKIEDVYFGYITEDKAANSIYDELVGTSALALDNMNGPANLTYYASSSLSNPQLKAEVYSIGGKRIDSNFIGSPDKLTDFVMQYGALGPKLIDKFFPAFSEEVVKTELTFFESAGINSIPVLSDIGNRFYKRNSKFNKKDGGYYVYSSSYDTRSMDNTNVIIHVDKNRRISCNTGHAIVKVNSITGDTTRYYLTDGKLGRINSLTNEIEYGDSNVSGNFTKFSAEEINKLFEGFSHISLPTKPE